MRGKSGKSTDSALARDILEWHVPEEVFAVLLKDHSTGRNLIWAMDDYARKLRRLEWVKGEMFGIIYA